jgi:hypothetical protein
MILCVNDGGKCRELAFSHPPKPQSEWRPGQSRLDKSVLDIADLRDKTFRLRLTKSEAADLELMLELQQGDMTDDGE